MSAGRFPASFRPASRRRRATGRPAIQDALRRALRPGGLKSPFGNSDAACNRTCENSREFHQYWSRRGMTPAARNLVRDQDAAAVLGIEPSRHARVGNARYLVSDADASARWTLWSLPRIVFVHARVKRVPSRVSIPRGSVACS